MKAENIGNQRPLAPPQRDGDTSVGLDAVPLFKPRIILEGCGRMIACSENARQIVKAAEPVRLERGCVVPASGKYRNEFNMLLNVEVGCVVTFLLPCLRSAGHWIVRATASEDDQVYLSLQQADPDNHAVLADIRKAFSLTPCEADVVQGLYNGLSPQEIFLSIPSGRICAAATTRCRYLAVNSFGTG
jgi:hypothetical protein